MKKTFAVCTLCAVLVGCTTTPLANPFKGVSSTSSVPALPPLPPVSEWPLYQDAEFWFELRYPPGYRIEVTAGDPSGRRKVAMQTGDNRPPSFKTVSFLSSEHPSFAITAFRGVGEGTIISEFTDDPRCGITLADTIILSRVFVMGSIRVLEKQQRVADDIDIDLCFINRQRYILSLHAWKVPALQSEEAANVLHQVLDTVKLYRHPPEPAT